MMGVARFPFSIGIPMRRWLLALALLSTAACVSAADVCPVLRNQMAAADTATRIAAVACNEHLLWYRAFIDRNGRLASATVSEGEATRLGDGQSQAWRHVARYWQESGLLRSAQHRPGASDCQYAGSEAYPAPACRGFVIDNAWSATFVSWVMLKAGLPGFRPDASHVGYVRAAYREPQANAYQYLDPAHARPGPGDLLCYVRQPGRVFGYPGLQTVVQGEDGLNMHCEIVVAANPGNDGTAYLIGGNVQQGVTLRMLALNRNGEFWGLPLRSGDDTPCSPDTESGCNFNRQDWAVLLKLKPAQALAQLPPAPGLVAGPWLPAQPATPRCCIRCVVGAGVPRCPPDQTQ